MIILAINLGNLLSVMNTIWIELLLVIYCILTLFNSSGDLQPSTAIANQLPGHLVSTQI